MERLSLKKAILVEGKYDKIRLEAVVDAPIFTADGFRIFSDSTKLSMLRKIAEETGLIILTDSDRAGFIIRQHVYGAIDKRYVENVYIPDVFGKEKRKKKAGKEGKIGVEGFDAQRLKDILVRAGVCDGERKPPHTTRMDFYDDGLLGTENSVQRRKKLLEMMELPTHLSVSALLDMVNVLLSRQEYEEKVRQLCEIFDTDVETDGNKR